MRALKITGDRQHLLTGGPQPMLRPALVVALHVRRQGDEANPSSLPWTRAEAEDILSLVEALGGRNAARARVRSSLRQGRSTS
jgi:hypothetical protein